MHQEARVTTIKERLKLLSKYWYEKAKQVHHHPLVTNEDNYEYDPCSDQHEPPHNIIEQRLKKLLNV